MSDCKNCSQKDCPIKELVLDKIIENNKESISLGAMALMLITNVPDSEITTETFKAATEIATLLFSDLCKTDIALRKLKAKYDILMEAESGTKSV